MRQYGIDAFTGHVFAGNPAAVCVMDRWLDEAKMMAITIENNLSETAFAVREGEKYHLRWFTPGGEIDLCGHATLGTACAIMTFVEPERTQITFSTISGKLTVVRRGDRYELDLVLRNNITTKEHPLGVYHPHKELHHIKKENIGLIEVMGLAVLPARLKGEMERLADAIVTGQDLRADEATEKHADWAEEFLKKYSDVNIENVHEILYKEIGSVFSRVCNP